MVLMVTLRQRPLLPQAQGTPPQCTATVMVHSMVLDNETDWALLSHKHVGSATPWDMWGLRGLLDHWARSDPAGQGQGHGPEQAGLTWVSTNEPPIQGSEGLQGLMEWELEALRKHQQTRAWSGEYVGGQGHVARWAPMAQLLVPYDV